jgi:hypothetical protein
MSSAFFPQGMHSYNNSLSGPLTAEYITWKGTGMYSNPVAVTAGNIRPLTNNDVTNDTVYKHGSARPIKQYRKGTSTPVPVIKINPLNPNEYIQLSSEQTNRQVKSSKSYSLIGQLIDRPGQFSVKENTVNEVNGIIKLDKDCKTCDGIGLVADYSPQYFLTNNPLPVCQTPQNCCNEQRKALLRVRPASTILKKNYFTTLQQYRQNRCQTYDQKVFNFYSGSTLVQNVADLKNNPNITAAMLSQAKPGDPIGLSNTYVANCYPNTGSSTFTQLELIAQAFQVLNNNGVFSTADITNFYNLQIETVQQFAIFIQNLESGESVQAVDIFKRFITNPYYGMSLSGPSNPRGCKLVVYKPSNYQFATQGSVSSSTRTLKLSVTTIEKNVYNNNRLKGSANNFINIGGQPYVPLIYKSKSPGCNPGQYIRNGNPKTCFRNSDDYFYKNITNLGKMSSGPTVANNGISASHP